MLAHKIMLCAYAYILFISHQFSVLEHYNSDNALLLSLCISHWPQPIWHADHRFHQTDSVEIKTTNAYTVEASDIYA